MMKSWTIETDWSDWNLILKVGLLGFKPLITLRKIKNWFEAKWHLTLLLVGRWVSVFKGIKTIW